MTTAQADKLSKLHYRAVKAAQRMTAATPGTETMKRREAAYERAEAAFGAALSVCMTR